MLPGVMYVTVLLTQYNVCSAITIPGGKIVFFSVSVAILGLVN